MHKKAVFMTDKPAVKARSVNVRVSEETLARFASAQKVAASHGKQLQLTHIMRTAIDMAIAEVERKYGAVAGFPRTEEATRPFGARLSPTSAEGGK